MKTLCSICARGGSKGVPNKNLKLIAGKPLIAHTILRAIETGIFQHIAISSDSDEILTTAKEFGADILIKRPDELAGDKAAKLPVIQHCAEMAEQKTKTEFDYFIDLDATSPLRKASDIVGTFELLKNAKFANIITGCPSRRSPYFNLVELGNSGNVRLSKELDSHIIRRQDAPKTFDLNASIYAWTRNSLFEQDKVISENTGLFEMPEERSIDIDSPLDFQIVEFLMNQPD